MTADLDRLIEAVEAGKDIFPSDFPKDFPKRQWAIRANEGSLGAAVTFLEALLPDYGWEICCDGWASVFTGEVSHGSRIEERSIFSSRALLLATLRAYRSTYNKEAHPMTKGDFK